MRIYILVLFGGSRKNQNTMEEYIQNQLNGENKV